MKLMIASDLHGSAYYTRKLLEAYEKEAPGKLILLGDILYHGPRNDLPEGYAPKEVIAMLNPLADKLLVIAAMSMFCEWGVFPAWALMIVLTREFAVTGLRLVAVQNGTVIAAGWSGKVKTFSTMVGLCVMMALPQVAWISVAVMVVIVATTLYSGVEYFIQNWNCLWD